MRVFFKVLALVSLSISLLFGIFDIARSVALSRLAMMPILDGWENYFPEYLSMFSGFIRQYFWSGFWEGWMMPVLYLPAWGLFLVLSILFYTIAIMPGESRKR
ncbi:hypothetical protein [Pseudochrobactrum sp. MP213Fo]|uniref:hypothetical protein n=1 Tax=Pseudochrobactrum sp. MP213Fo TaxID=3022250 RepID=UPI003BA3A9AD